MSRHDDMRAQLHVMLSRLTAAECRLRVLRNAAFGAYVSQFLSEVDELLEPRAVVH